MKISFASILLLIILATCRQDVSEERIETDSTIYFQSNSLHAVVFKPTHQLEFYRPDTSISILDMWPILGAQGWIPREEQLLAFKKQFDKYARSSQNDSLSNILNLTEIRYKLEYIDSVDFQFVGFIDSLKTRKIFVNIGFWENEKYPFDPSFSWRNNWIFIEDGGGTYHSIYNADADSIELLEFN